MLNNEQEKVVNSDAKKILCLAGAGTGKTYSMIARISRLVENDVDVSDILVLTFTNAAAFEMKERYRKQHTNEATPTFCTFHSFCYSLIALDPSIRRKLGYSDVPKIADDATIRKISAICKQQCGTKLSEDKLNGKINLNSKEKFQYDIYWKQYDKLLRQNKLITFDILCYEVCKLFSNNDPITDSYKSKYKYIFVDEFQDTDKKQWEFVSSFTDSNLFVVGDAKQSIYQFRGADSTIIKSLAANHEWKTIRLSQNYRSTRQICEFSNQIHNCWDDSPYNLHIHSEKNGVEVHVESPFHFDFPHGIKDVEKIKKTVFTNKSSALLCRTNAEVNIVKSLLQKIGVVYHTKSKNTDVSDILKSAMDSNYMVDWLSSLLPSKEYHEYIRFCAIDHKYETEIEFLRLYPYEFIQAFAKQIHEVQTILNSDQFIGQKCVNLSSFLGLQNIEVSADLQTNEDLVEYMIEQSKYKVQTTNVYVGTIHSVKGLEYDVVHLLGVNGKSFPILYDDNRNLYYVGCTRAKQELYIWKS